MVFAFAQSLIAVGVTLAPGFFDNVVGLTIERSPIFIFPLIGLGVVVGLIFVQKTKKQSSFFWAIGSGAISIAALFLCHDKRKT